MKILNRMRTVLMLTAFTMLAALLMVVFVLVECIFFQNYDACQAGALLYILFPCFFTEMMVYGFAFPCPHCHKQLSSMPVDIMFRKGFFSPHKRIFNIIRGKELECLHCGWNAKNENATNNDHDADA